MLYLWPFIAFFSFPLFLPTVVSALSPTLPRPSTLAWSLFAVSLSLGVVHFNTLIHPFTLADNRHYMFYVFRYTILRHPLIKYALAPIYVFCGWLALRALCNQGVDSSSVTARRGKSSRPTVPGSERKPVGETRTSFVLIWLITTALSLITAPLVEPRYFILPWVLWRLHVRPSRGSFAGLDIERSRLWGETLWFMVVNVGTCVVFLGKGFEWASEPGVVQRFMW
jgi:alpha-1,2-glucosyltransferase